MLLADERILLVVDAKGKIGSVLEHGRLTDGVHRLVSAGSRDSPQRLPPLVEVGIVVRILHLHAHRAPVTSIDLSAGAIFGMLGGERTRGV